MSKKRVDEVFGISNQVLSDSYVDRGRLDEELSRYLRRPTHVALRGESKCGKSWLRQAQVHEALTIQCRLNKSVEDLYVDALSQLDIRLAVQESRGGAIRGTVSAKGQLGARLLAAVGLEASVEGEGVQSNTTKAVGHDIEDLRFVASLIAASGKRLVIEDFHYMSTTERRKFAFDLKALWEFGLFVVVVGVWSQSNLLLYLNPDLSGRVHEIPIYWSDDDLARVLDKGGAALNLSFTAKFKERAIHDCFGNVGILQKLIQVTLDELQIDRGQGRLVMIDQLDRLESASMHYAEQLNPLYQQFARRVASGIRQRPDSTGIYAHAMAVILESPDEILISGVGIDQIYAAAHAREVRIQKGNLRSVLEKFESLQVDEDGRGLVLGYDEANSEISVVDRQLLLYRRYATVKWPWEQLIVEATDQAARDGA